MHATARGNDRVAGILANEGDQRVWSEGLDLSSGLTTRLQR
jgi:hypothetical protein